ncbi:integrase [Sinomonas cyclohexanicum]|uniref:Integrase n=1 Tax=Sinomonas cyclohexanicum TaxID=322009 RepID=A0ABM7PQ97_SINCY|nr:integrase [Corynebacterium cyclohexanicum]BCT76113.1 integrase [Corynebacterium cyclohexanicum]
MFAAALEDYLAFKEAMGLTGSSRIWYLKRFDAYCTRHGATALDRATVEGWVTEQLQSCGTYRSWMSYIRDFGRWLAAHRDPDAYVLSSAWKAPFVRAHPFLLTNSQIERFFTAAADVTAESPWQWQAVAFFTLMHSCGIRTGEARALQRGSVELETGHVTIVESKGRRSRRLPVTDEVTTVLRLCDEVSRERFRGRDTFFVSAAGTPVTAASVGVIFHRIWDQAGLPRPSGGTQPRPYDFRHHFAYANLERWMTDGTDVAAMLPYLSVYMGHASIDSTYYYVHTSPDFLHAYAGITRESSRILLPEVGFE